LENPSSPDIEAPGDSGFKACIPFGGPFLINETAPLSQWKSMSIRDALSHVAEKHLLHRLLKNAQMQGTRNRGPT